VSQLRSHLCRKHKELSRYGINVGAEGRLEYSEKAINFALYLAKLYPR
jgi:hypothetical protein